MGHTSFPTEERVENYRKARKMSIGTRSDVSTKIPMYGTRSDASLLLYVLVIFY